MHGWATLNLSSSAAYTIHWTTSGKHDKCSLPRITLLIWIQLRTARFALFLNYSSSLLYYRNVTINKAYYLPASFSCCWRFLASEANWYTISKQSLHSWVIRLQHSISVSLIASVDFENIVSHEFLQNHQKIRINKLAGRSQSDKCKNRRHCWLNVG